MDRPFKIVYIPIENKKRELTSKCLLAISLLEKGFSVVIADKMDARHFAKYCTPGILLDKSYTADLYEEWRAVRYNGGRIYAIDEEAVQEIFGDVFRYRVGDRAISIAKGLFLWGDIQQKELVNMGVSKNKLFVVGNPRMDLTGSNAFFFYSNEIDKLRKAYGNYILFNLNYALEERNGDVVEVAYKAAGRSINDVDEGLEKTMRGMEFEFNELLSVVEAVSKAFPQYNVVVRPHPSEQGLKKLQKRYEGLENVIVSREGDATPWILGSSVMIHSGCTTAIEAYLNRKASIVYCTDLNHYLPVYSDVSILATSEQELIGTIRNYINGRITHDEIFNWDRDSMLKGHIYIDANKPSCDKIAEILNRDDYNVEGEFSFQPKIDYIWWMRRWIAHIRGRDLLEKFELTSARELRRLIYCACKTRKYPYERILIKAVGANAFLIREKPN